jgi:hypothetical protein
MTKSILNESFSERFLKYSRISSFNQIQVISEELLKIGCEALFI